ncbi:uncharacterized protein EI90DRAFT_2366856 [Cantharellus anzutake]|uniref:uncharacterized protein n=1 Tax=Cantharellus anzutake TaxID=1750568 RepID=UPI0019088C23|nr:uncharacterized protein EI90DRAFT_2366856 [Cantharellus anzutake]KAF8324199.1 hypothetical protein EI90DRAFT_2366856 [Cantharellus anzutake]
MVLPYIPQTITSVISPPDMDPREIGNESASTAPSSVEQASSSHSSTIQSPAAAEIPIITPTPSSADPIIPKPSTIPTVHPQSAPNAPDDRDEESTTGQKESRQSRPLTQTSLSTGHKRPRGGRYQLGNRTCARKRIKLGTGQIQECYGTKGMVPPLSLDVCKMWPPISNIDKTLGVPGLNADARSKLLHSVDLRVIPCFSQTEAFVFPYRGNSKLKQYLESPRHDSKNWKPVLMTAKQALAMGARVFQGKVNDGTPIVLVDRTPQVPFCLSGIVKVEPKVRCIGKLCLPSFHPVDRPTFRF